jgi:hypothetical protein
MLIEPFDKNLAEEATRTSLPIFSPHHRNNARFTPNIRVGGSSGNRNPIRYSLPLRVFMLTSTAIAKENGHRDSSGLT